MFRYCSENIIVFHRDSTEYVVANNVSLMLLFLEFVDQSSGTKTSGGQVLSLARLPIPAGKQAIPGRSSITPKEMYPAELFKRNKERRFACLGKEQRKDSGVNYARSRSANATRILHLGRTTSFSEGSADEEDGKVGGSSACPVLEDEQDVS